MHGMGFCCCPAGCDYFTDEFTRADHEDPGADYTVLVGSWPIASNCLTTSDANASVQCNTEHPTSGTAYRVSVAMQGNEEGDQLQAWINNDPTTFGEVTFHTNGSTGRARLRLFVGGAIKGETDIYAPPGEWVYVYLCTDGDHLALGVPGTLYLSAPVTITSSVCGLGTGTLDGGTAAKFDDFKLTKHETDDATCPACGESCTYFADGALGDPTNQIPALNPTTLIIVGTWTWDYFDALITSDANARIKVTLDNPSGIPHFIQAQCAPVALNPYRKAWLFADYQDEDNCLFLRRWNHGDPLQHTVEFGRRILGVETIIDSWTTDWIVSGGEAWAAISVGATKSCGFLGFGWEPATWIPIGSVFHTPTVARGAVGSGSESGINVDVWCRAIILKKHNDTDLACSVPACSDESEKPCQQCEQTPKEWEIAISDIGVGSCTEVLCNPWNSVFIAQQDNPEVTPCIWSYKTSCAVAGCSLCEIILSITQEGPDVKITVTARACGVIHDVCAPAWEIAWSKTYPNTTVIDCMNLIGEELTLKSSSLLCDGSSGTCQITAL